MQELKPVVKTIAKVTVELLEDGRVALCKRLDDDPMGHAISQSFTPSSNEELGSAVAEMLEAE